MAVNGAGFILVGSTECTEKHSPQSTFKDLAEFAYFLTDLSAKAKATPTPAKALPLAVIYPNDIM